MRTYNNAVVEHVETTGKKNILHKICSLSCAVLALVMVSCGALTDMETLKESDGDLVKITIAVTDDARTAYPVLTERDFAEYLLNCDGVNKGWWQKDTQKNLSAYEVMNTDPIYVTKGTHTFVLSGTEANGAKYSASVTKNVMQSGEISFALEFVDVSVEGSGTLKIDVNYPVENLSKIVVKRYASADERSYKTAVVEKETTVTTGLTGNYSYTEGNASIDSGAYIVEFNFYGLDDIPLCDPWPELAYISNGLESVSSINIDSFDDVYAINYDAASVGDAVFSRKPLRYTWRSEITLPTAEEVTRTGYTFEGWYTSVDGEGNPTGEPVTGWLGTEKSGPVTLYAKWIPDTYSIKYYTNLSSDGALSGTPFETQSAGHGTKLTAPETNPAKSGYTFAHWTTSADNAVYDFENTEVTGDTTLYAVWSCSVTFDANTNAATGEMEAETFLTSWLGTVTKALTANAYELDGYSFLGWADADNADEADYADGGFVAFTEAKTLYAVWHDDSTGFVVSFEVNGGTPVASQSIEAAGNATEPDNCTKEDCALVGWYTDSALTAAYDFATPVNATLRLYAKWVRSVYYVSSQAASNGSGTKESPCNSVANAVAKIRNNGNASVDFIVAVSGELYERVNLTATSLTASNARSLTIRGLNGSDTDILNGSRNGTVLTLETQVPVIIADITITNGFTDVDRSNNYATGNASGIRINANSTLTIKNGTVISNNETKVKAHASSTSSVSSYANGGGVYNAGTLIMEDGLIADNTAYAYAYNSGDKGSNTRVYGAGVYNIGTFTMKGGLITGNKVTSEATHRYYRANSTAEAYGGGVYSYNATFSMEGGCIENNTLVSTSDTASAAHSLGAGVYCTTSINMAGNAHFVNNDLYLTSSAAINLIGPLTAQTPVALITPYSYSNGKVIVTAEDGVTLSDEAPKFACSNVSWKIDEEGKLASRTTYSITYYLDGGTHEAGYPASHGAGQVTALRGAVKTGYAFGGWYTTSTFDGEPVTELTDENCTSAISLYAKWTEKSFFTISYKDTDGESYTGTNLESLVVRHYPGETETLVNAVKNGYVFDAWYLKSDFSGEPVTVLSDENCTEDTVLYAKWKPHCTITYKDAGGTDFSGTLASESPTFHNYSVATTLREPSKTGSVFLGWYIDWYERDGKYYGVRNALTTLSGTGYKNDITLYALWAEDTSTVQIDTHTFDLTHDSSTYTLTATEGYVSYTWLVDDEIVTDGDSAWSVSEDGTSLTYSAGNLIQGYVYTVKVRAYDENGVLFEKTKTLTR